MSNLLCKNHLLLEKTLFTCQVHILNTSQNDELAQFSFTSSEPSSFFFQFGDAIFRTESLSLDDFALRGHVTSF